MIKANELRIGNYIANDEGALSRVIGFEPYGHSVRCDEDEGCEILIDIYGIDGNVRRGFVVESNLIKPIPLTPEWLERCGFEKIKEEDSNSYLSYSTIKLDGIIAKQEDGWYQMITDMDGYHEQNLGVKLEFVHQLQNRYYSLTGEELNVKL